MGSSWGPAIDYLVAGLPAPLKLIDTNVVVSDNEPVISGRSAVFIGRSGPDNGAAGQGSNAYTQLGAGRIEEDYTLPGYIQCWRPGPSQKPARDAALALFDGVVAFVHADPTLGALLQRGRIALAGQMSFHQTQDEEDMAGGALFAGIDFELQIHNTYIPGS